MKLHHANFIINDFSCQNSFYIGIPESSRRSISIFPFGHHVITCNRSFCLGTYNSGLNIKCNFAFSVRNSVICCIYLFRRLTVCLGSFAIEFYCIIHSTSLALHALRVKLRELHNANFSFVMKTYS